jgi:hypothetical protein
LDELLIEELLVEQLELLRELEVLLAEQLELLIEELLVEQLELLRELEVLLAEQLELLIELLEKLLEELEYTPQLPEIETTCQHKEINLK